MLSKRSLICTEKALGCLGLQWARAFSEWGGAGCFLLGSYTGAWSPLFLEVLLSVVLKSFPFWKLIFIIFQCPAFYSFKLKQIIRRSSWVLAISKGRWMYLERFSNSTPSHFSSSKSWSIRLTWDVFSSSVWSNSSWDIWPTHKSFAASNCFLA